MVRSPGERRAKRSHDRLQAFVEVPPLRIQRLQLSISTATGNNAGIGRQLWDYAGRVLDGAQEGERLFALVHAAEPEDDPWDEATWVKANPSGAKPSSRTRSAPSCARPGTTRRRRRRPRRGT